MSKVSTKRIHVARGTYLEIGVACRPTVVSEWDWNRLGSINDYIIDHVSYDHDRANSPDLDGVQPPRTTRDKAMGVCMDYTAMFERLARKHGYRVRSVTSETLCHAWNEVFLARRWWIVDVTWNDADATRAGQPIPRSIRDDPDFRRRYFLTTVEDEEHLVRLGLLHSTHRVRDPKPVDYEATLEARALIDRITPLVEEQNAMIRRQALIIARHNQVVGQYNRAVAGLNSQATAAAQESYAARLAELRTMLDALDSQITRLSSVIDERHGQVSELYDTYKRLEARYPLAVSYSMSQRQRPSVTPIRSGVIDLQ